MHSPPHIMASLLQTSLTLLFLLFSPTSALVRHYKFNVVQRNTTRLCTTKPIVTVNGEWPGPTLIAREDDTVIVKVVNHVPYNISIHWHGVRQLRTGWADGPAYITQCPIQRGGAYVYNFTLTGQRGTLLWHAHILWLRVTLHGGIVILPRLGVPYPFPKPHEEVVIILGEWWNSDVEKVVKESLQLGSAPNISDAHTINGLPGLSPTCSSDRGLNIKVERGKTYLLRIINAAMNDELFFKVANHMLKIVEVDAVYTKPFSIDTILLAPGQTTNALLQTNLPPSNYSILVSPFMDSPISINNFTAKATLHYSNPNNPTQLSTTIPPLINSTLTANTFISSLRSLNSQQFPARVPLSLNHSLFFTVGLGLTPCPTCAASGNGTRAVASINNVTFTMPTTALLQAHYYNITGVFTDDFPSNPPVRFNFTGRPPVNLLTSNGTRVYRLRYGDAVQVVLQDTGLIALENHPLHLHGFNFFGVGRGVGNFDPFKDSSRFNLVDPVERNTIGVPSGGWVAIRFRADNPGVWFMHCHLEVHTTWGLKMAFVVDDGEGPNESLMPPPLDFPKC